MDASGVEQQAYRGDLVTDIRHLPDLTETVLEAGVQLLNSASKASASGQLVIALINKLTRAHQANRHQRIAPTSREQLQPAHQVTGQQFNLRVCVHVLHHVLHLYQSFQQE